MGQSVRKDVAGSNLNGLLEKIVFEDNKARGRGVGKGHDLVPVLKNVDGGEGAAVDAEIYGQ